MRFHVTLTLLGFSLLGNHALAAPGGLDNACSPTSCMATHITSIFVRSSPITTFSYQTITSVATIPHSCFTYLTPVPQSNNPFCGTINLSTCGPVIQCITIETLTFPCHDPCCPITPTVTTPGGCVSCRTGCATSTTIVTATNCAAKPTSTHS